MCPIHNIHNIVIIQYKKKNIINIFIFFLQFIIKYLSVSVGKLRLTAPTFKLHLWKTHFLTHMHKHTHMRAHSITVIVNEQILFNNHLAEVLFTKVKIIF